MAKIGVWVFLCLALVKSFETIGMETSQNFSIKDVNEKALKQLKDVIARQSENS